jgi:oxygen-independent coproporphyrinogen-3 oxidase
MRAIDGGALASARGCRLDDEDVLRGRIIERLMCDFEVDLGKVAPQAEFSDEFAMLGPMIRDGLVEVDGSRLIVTDAGRPVVRVIAAAFDTYRRPASAQFSKAI